ncbi:MAG: hypothetical protein NC299_01025 [Lachnospiraceae bacterium]|nr:hypothetical protein [Ruminococcus sp.]MCM1273930.1 hypothetical protein [Lachnospiraceae bacterium]
MKKRFSPESAVVLVTTLAAMAMIVLGAMNGNVVVAVSGLALGFLGIMAGNVVRSVIAIKRRYPERGNPLHGKMRAARYTSTAAATVITIAMITLFVGYFLMTAIDMSSVFFCGVGLMIIGVVMAIMSSIASKLTAKELSKVQTVSNEASSPPPVSAAAARVPYSPDPVISRILANPYVLQDERIRQLHEIQNLLQYPEIQQIFFEPANLYTLFENEKTGELLNVVRERLTRNDAEEIFAAAEKRRPADMQPTFAPPPEEKPLPQTAPPKHEKAFIVGFIIVFIAVFIVVAVFSVTGERLN